MAELKSTRCFVWVAGKNNEMVDWFTWFNHDSCRALLLDSNGVWLRSLAAVIICCHYFFSFCAFVPPTRWSTRFKAAVIWTNKMILTYCMFESSLASSFFDFQFLLSHFSWTSVMKKVHISHAKQQMTCINQMTCNRSPLAPLITATWGGAQFGRCDLHVCYHEVVSWGKERHDLEGNVAA